MTFYRASKTSSVKRTVAALLLSLAALVAQAQQRVVVPEVVNFANVRLELLQRRAQENSD